MSEIRVLECSFAFGAGAVLDRVSFVVPDGAVFVLTGPSGGGKSTLLRLIAGFASPAAGEIFIGGRRVSGAGAAVAPNQRGIGMVFQSLALWPHLSAAQHLRFTGAGREETARLLDAVGLGDVASRRPDELSGGQKQRLAIARALARAPRVLLFDEAFNNLDPPFRHELNALLRRMWERSPCTALFVTHDPDEVVLPVAGHLLLEDGAIHGPGALDELLAARGSRYAESLRELRARRSPGAS